MDDARNTDNERDAYIQTAREVVDQLQDTQLKSVIWKIIYYFAQNQMFTKNEFLQLKTDVEVLSQSLRDALSKNQSLQKLLDSKSENERQQEERLYLLAKKIETL